MKNKNMTRATTGKKGEAGSLAWKVSANVFHSRAEEYDRWFEDNPLFQIELAALRSIETELASPRLEIGVGPGRFAEALDVHLGLDPALAPLRLAAARGLTVCAGLGEELPIRTGSLGTIFLLFTLCFLADPAQALAECGRCLKPGGHLVLGMVPAASAWGRLLAAKKQDNHPFYRHARFYNTEKILKIMAQTDLKVTEPLSTLYQKPGAVRNQETAKPGVDDRAGFVILVGRKGNNP